jgi:hypothetical protein
VTDSPVLAKLLRGAPALAQLTQRYGKSIEDADVLVRLATAHHQDPDFIEFLTLWFRDLEEGIKRDLRADVTAKLISGDDATKLTRILDELRGRLRKSRVPSPAQPALPPKPLERPLTLDDIADVDRLGERRMQLIGQLRNELDSATLRELDKLTVDDWNAILRRAVEMRTPAAKNLKGLIQELYTLRLPEFEDAVKKARWQFDNFKGAEGWRFEVWHGLQALNLKGKEIRDFADKGAFAVFRGSLLNMAIPLMLWEDKNESNVGDLVGKKGQFARIKKRARYGLIRHQGQDYFVSEQVMQVIFPRLYGAAPALPSEKAFMTLPAAYRAVTRIYKSPLSSETLEGIAKRVFRIIGR